jgi:hypothetical protein
MALHSGVEPVEDGCATQELAGVRALLPHDFGGKVVDYITVATAESRYELDVGTSVPLAGPAQ